MEVGGFQSMRPVSAACSWYRPLLSLNGGWDLLNRRGSYLALSFPAASLGLPCFVFSHCLFFGRGRSLPHLFVSQLRVSLFLSSLNSHVNNRSEKTEWLVCILGSAILTQQRELSGSSHHLGYPLWAPEPAGRLPCAHQGGGNSLLPLLFLFWLNISE